MLESQQQVILPLPLPPPLPHKHFKPETPSSPAYSFSPIFPYSPLFPTYPLLSFSQSTIPPTEHGKTAEFLGGLPTWTLKSPTRS